MHSIRLSVFQISPYQAPRHFWLCSVPPSLGPAIQDTHQKDNPDKSNGSKFGFKIYRLTRSYFQEWVGIANRTSQEYLSQLKIQIDTLMREEGNLGLITELLLKEGLPLTSVIQSKRVSRNEVFIVIDRETTNQFYICRDEKIPIDLPSKIGLNRDQTFICRDNALDDTAAANISLKCHLKTI